MTARSPVPPPPEEESVPRGDAGRILQAVLRSVDPAPLVEQAIRSSTLPTGSRTALLAVGKAAWGMAQGAVAALGTDTFSRGMVLLPYEPASPETLPFPIHRGGHPLPTEEGVHGASLALGMIRALGPDEHLLLLLSGGGSALLSLPAEGLTLPDLRTVTRLLLEAGAPIEELNAVRKHLERLKGGRLAAEVGGRSILALAVSDVVGDPHDAIASGPVSPDPTTYREALEILERHGVRDAVPPAVITHLMRGVHGDVLETPKPGDPRLSTVEFRLVAGVGHAMEGAAREARGRGYRTHKLSSSLEGEARATGRRLGALGASLSFSQDAGSPICLVSGGETTVRVRGTGRGGRNQEVALGAALEIADRSNVLIASFGTDGVDGPTDAAGALATGSTVPRARIAGLDPEAALRENDAYPFFQALDDLFITGPTGTNVMDVQIVLVGDRPSG